MIKLKWYSVASIFSVLVIIYYSLYLIAIPEFQDLAKLLIISGIILGTIIGVDRLNIPSGEFKKLNKKDLSIWFSIGSMYVIVTLYFAVVYPEYFSIAIIYFSMNVFSLIIAPLFFYMMKWDFVNIYTKEDIYWLFVGLSLLILLTVLFSALKISASILPLPIFFVLLFPVVEEAMFRGVLFIQFLQVSFTFSLLAQSIIFALFHSYVYHGNIYYLAYLFLFGIILSYITAKSKSILPAFVLHILNNLLAVI